MMISTIIIIIRQTVVSYMKGFLMPSALGDTRRETQLIRAYANHTMLTPPPAAHLVVSKI